jgi:hypothetical protein
MSFSNLNAKITSLSSSEKLKDVDVNYYYMVTNKFTNQMGNPRKNVQIVNES